MCVEAVVSCRPYSERFFLGSPGFSSFLKNQHFEIPIGSGK